MRNTLFVLLFGVLLTSCELANTLFHPTDLGVLVKDSWGDIAIENPSSDPDFFLVGTNQIVRLYCKTVSLDPVLEVRVDLSSIGAGGMKLNPNYSRTEWTGVSFVVPPELGIKDIKMIALNSKGLQITNILSVTVSTNEEVIYVSASGNDANLGTLKGAPLLTLGKAVEKSGQTGIKTVYLSGGVYANVYSGFHVNLLLQNQTNLSLYGGWNGEFSVRDAALYETVIDRVHNPSTGVAVINSVGILLDGITIRGVELSDDIVDMFATRGGGIAAVSSSLVLRNVKLVANEALAGGGLFCSQSAVWLTNVSFLSNNAKTGAGMFVFQSDPQIAGCLFSANQNGGGIVFTNLCNAYITNSVFQYNGSSKPGGAIAYYGSFISLYSNTFVNNYGGQMGGAVFALSCSNGVFYRNSFAGHQVGKYGGAVMLKNCPSTYEFYNNLFSGNRAFFGGALCASNTLKIDMDGNLFSQNSSTYDAGVTHNGGAVSLYSTPYEIKHCVFSGNAAESFVGYGGAVFAMSSPGLIVSSWFSNNTAYYSGGALMLGSSPVIILSNTFYYNKVYYHSGGAIFANSCQMTMKWNQWISNYSYELGGAIYFYSCVATNINCWSQGTYNSVITFDGSSSWKLGYTFISNLLVLGGYPASYKATLHNSGGMFTNTYIQNTFGTNSIGFLYIKEGGRHITNNSDWVNINNPLAMITYPNSTNNKITNL